MLQDNIFYDQLHNMYITFSKLSITEKNENLS